MLVTIMVLPAPVSPVTTVRPGCSVRTASLITPRSVIRSSVITVLSVPGRPHPPPRGDAGGDRRFRANPSTGSSNLLTSRSVKGDRESLASCRRCWPRPISISIPARNSTERLPSHHTTPCTGEASISSTMTIDVGPSTSGRANRAWALSGTTSSASSSGHSTGPPAENAYAVDPVGVATSTPSQAQRDSGRPSISTAISSIRSRAAFSMDTSLTANEVQITSPWSRSVTSMVKRSSTVYVRFTTCSTMLSISAASASARNPTWPRFTPSRGVSEVITFSAPRRIVPSPPSTSISSTSPVCSANWPGATPTTVASCNRAFRMSASASGTIAVMPAADSRSMMPAAVSTASRRPRCVSTATRRASAVGWAG